MPQDDCPRFFSDNRLRRVAARALPRTRTGLLRFIALAAACAVLLISGLRNDGLANDLEFQWPLIKGEAPELRGLTSTFGESRNDRFHNGLDIAGLGDPVRPVAGGFYLYSRDMDDDPYAPMPGPGNSVFLYHGDGWWSGYYHLQDLEGRPRRGMVERESVIGTAGNTGHSGGPHLHFFISSGYGERILNPFQYLPGAVDENPPQIGPLVIVTPLGQTYVNHSREERFRLTQPYPIQVQIDDPGLEPYTRRGVYRLSWRLNGGEVQSRSFGHVELREGQWLLEGRHPFERVFAHGHYTLGELNFQDGMNTLQVRAEDYAGNAAEVLFTVKVDREY